MRMETELKLDYKDVLIRPKRSRLTSRSNVDLARTFRFPHAEGTWTGVPIVAANMDTVGSLGMAAALAPHGLMTALHKFYAPTDYADWLLAQAVLPAAPPPGLAPADSVFLSFGITGADIEKLHATAADLRARTGAPPRYICLDVANGYSERFAQVVAKVRDAYPQAVLMAGNVVTGEMTEQLVLSGADIVKVGIGPGSVCTTRKMTGVGYPQLSAVIECADAAHGLKGLVCADGGCTVPGDIAKAFAAGADFVMLGGMLAGHDEGGGRVVTRRFLTWELDENNQRILREEKTVEFYGMSSEAAMDRHYGGVAEYRASEGKRVEIPYRGAVAATVQEILGGLRSTCTYVGALRLKELSKRATFVMVSQQINPVFDDR